MISAAMAVAAAQIAGDETSRFAREARSGRLAALMVDTIVLAFLTGIVNAVYGVTEINSAYVAGNSSVTSTTTAVAWPWLTLMAIVYFTLGEAMFGATPGKAWLRLKVVRVDGTPPSLRDVIARNVGRLIDFLPVFYLLGGLLVVTGSYAQRAGDRIAGTTVVYRHRTGATRSSGRTARRILVAALAAAAVVTVLFDYFGRPPLVVDAMYKEGRLLPPGTQSYSLGAASWGFGEVTYPVTSRTATQTCSGTVKLRWSVLGWTEDSNQALCSPS